MTYRTYEGWNPSEASAKRVDEANEIIAGYVDQGYSLTLRQLYYQFVSKALIPNTQRSYKNLGTLIQKARMAGLISWTAIEDRTRNLTSWRTYQDAGDALLRLRYGYTLEKWKGQPEYVEVWIEKEALSGVFERICSELEVPFFACRGYVSASEMWSASQRLRGEVAREKRVTILHFGDHDPSGMDMTRDINDRAGLFGSRQIRVERIALNWDQIEEHSPPPNPAKMSDSRYEGYADEYGDESWELDALEPSVLSALVREEVDKRRDLDLWEESVKTQAHDREVLRAIADNWEDVEVFLEERGEL